MRGQWLVVCLLAACQSGGGTPRDASVDAAPCTSGLAGLRVTITDGGGGNVSCSAFGPGNRQLGASFWLTPANGSLFWVQVSGDGPFDVPWPPGVQAGVTVHVQFGRDLDSQDVATGSTDVIAAPDQCVDATIAARCDNTRPDAGP